MRVLEGFCRLVVGLDVEDRVSLKSVPFVYYCVKESNFVLWNFSCKFDWRVELVSLDLAGKIKKIPNLADKIWKIQDLAGKIWKFKILPRQDLENSRSCWQDLENSRSCAKIWKIQDLAGKTWKIQNLAGKIWKIPDLATHHMLTRCSNSRQITHQLAGPLYLRNAFWFNGYLISSFSLNLLLVVILYHIVSKHTNSFCKQSLERAHRDKCF